MKLLKYFVFLFIISSCQKPGCLTEAGPVEKVVRNAAGFNQIVLHDNINLVLTQDTTESIVVEGGKNLIPHIATTIEQNILTLKNNVSCKGLRSPGEIITVYVSVKALEQLDYNGSGDVTGTNTLVSNKLFIYSYNGAGNINLHLQTHVAGVYIHQENADVTLSGSSNEFFTYTNARGTIDLKDLEVRKMVIEYGSVRNAALHVTESLDAIIYHTGNLYYKGNPQVKLQTHSTGRLLRLP